VYFVADNRGSIFIRLAVVAAYICEITRNSVKTLIMVIQGHRSWFQSKVHMQLLIV